MAQSSRGECTEACRARRRELEAELAECRSTKHWAEERCAALERENAVLVDQLRDMDMLMSALSAMQEKNAHLENSLSAETRIKLDLFSALGEAKRQLEIRESECQVRGRDERHLQRCFVGFRLQQDAGARDRGAEEQNRASVGRDAERHFRESHADEQHVQGTTGREPARFDPRSERHGLHTQEFPCRFHRSLDDIYALPSPDSVLNPVSTANLLR